MRNHRISLLFLLVLALGSCSPLQPQVDASSTPPTENALQIVSSQTEFSNITKMPVDTQVAPMNNFLDDISATPPPATTDQFIVLAKQDLAGRLKINMDQITTLKIIEITWPDITQGCSPNPGEVLPKGKTTGYRIWLQVNGEAYVYHIGLNNQIVLCPNLMPGANNPLLMTPNGSPETPQDQSP